MNVERALEKQAVICGFIIFKLWCSVQVWALTESVTMSLHVSRCCSFTFSIISTIILHVVVSSADGSHHVDSTHQETMVSSMEQGVAERALFWLSPAFNFDIFTYLISFAFIPLLLIYVYVVYPPGKYYSSAPPPPEYEGHWVDNALFPWTLRNWWKPFWYAENFKCYCSNIVYVPTLVFAKGNN